MSGSRWYRLAVLAIAALAPTSATACAAVAGESESVTVMASWDPQQREGAAFQATLARFSRETGIDVRYQGVRTITSVLRLADLGDALPDIAVLSSPAELARYARAGRLVPLSPDDRIQNHQLLRGGDRQPYGVVLKTDLKSLIWYGTEAGEGAPQTWTDLVRRGADLRAAGRNPPWCLGMKSGAESGWPGTDWVEDILLHQSGVEAYRRWANGSLAWTSPEVRSAWEAWRQLLAAAGMTDGANVQRMLLTGWHEAGADLTGGGTGCAMEHQGSFVRALRDGYETFSPLPRFEPGPGPDGSGVEVSVDAAGLFSAKPAARQLLTYLASQAGQEDWIAHAGGSFFSARTDIDRAAAYRSDAVGGRIAEQLAATAGNRCLDASDFMPQTVANVFAAGVLEFLSDPASDRLPPILRRLDATRRAVPTTEWLSDPCP
ncbi:ABC transporter substrate-binding protein [Phytohabitans rumicis]|uniref:ABC transporter substrate-binding protein n=1 Tax=Phytohabitans rumicis TaxID=1076125 RepID=A0A6V8LIC0_9ACTN|nr:ABC transporter substrate-binding protein [Phytohabitans rumicis]GFJ93847.1 ABC transporter substrate-binding protein [Phytohabitans rumicis]